MTKTSISEWMTKKRQRRLKKESFKKTLLVLIILLEHGKILPLPRFVLSFSFIPLTILKQIAKSLVKREHQDVYTDLGPENPYWSDEEDDDEDTDKDGRGGELANPALEKAKRAKLHARSGGNSPVFSTASASPAPEPSKLKSSLSSNQPAAKRQKLQKDDGSGSRSGSVSRQGSQSPPPPPSAAQVIKKLERAQKRRGSRGPSASPAPSTASITAGPSSLSLEYVPVDTSILYLEQTDIF